MLLCVNVVELMRIVVDFKGCYLVVIDWELFNIGESVDIDVWG